MIFENVCDQNHPMGKYLQFLSYTVHISMKLTKEAIGKLIIEISMIQLFYEVIIHFKMFFLKVKLQ